MIKNSLSSSSESCFSCEIHHMWRSMSPPLSVCVSCPPRPLSWVTLGQDDRALRLPLLQGVPVWEEVCPERGESLLCEMLREPVLQHLWGVQEAHWLQLQGKWHHKQMYKWPMTCSLRWFMSWKLIITLEKIPLGNNFPKGMSCCW